MILIFTLNQEVADFFLKGQMIINSLGFEGSHSLCNQYSAVVWKWS